MEDGEHLIGGFVLAGEGARRLLIRGLGPGLAEFIPIEELVTDSRLGGILRAGKNCRERRLVFRHGVGGDSGIG